MNYQNHYNLLIAKYGTETKPTDGCYYERHHVIPRSLGGSDDPDNLRYLSGKAHYLAHYLLFKICGVGPMSHAFWMMSAVDRYGSRHVPSGRSYEVARAALSDREVSDDTKAKISLSWTPERRAKQSVATGNRTGLTHPRAKSVNIYCHYLHRSHRQSRLC